MKYIIRRFFLSLLVMPFVFAIYLAVYFVLSMLTPSPSGNLEIAISNLPAIGATVITGVTFMTNINRWLDSK
jgi:hypothetical protein